MRASWPALIIEGVGIADPAIHRHFATLSRIINSVEEFRGAVAECGVYRGNSLFGIAHRLRIMEKEAVPVFGFDSFEGFPQPTDEDRINGKYPLHALKETFGDTDYETISLRARSLGYSNIRLVKGYFENTLHRFSDFRFQIVHLDVGLYQSYKTCLEFFYPRLVTGGYIIFDEYDCDEKYPGARKAIDLFLADKPEKLECFPDLKPDKRYFIQKN